MMVTARRIGYVVTVTMLALATLAQPVAAQQLIDGGGENGGGGLAFVALTLMIFLIATAMFFMDRIRRRRSGD
jgi:hypothetical protein